MPPKQKKKLTHERLLFKKRRVGGIQTCVHRYAHPLVENEEDIQKTKTVNPFQGLPRCYITFIVPSQVTDFIFLTMKAFQ